MGLREGKILRLLIGITGATGVIYGIRLLRALAEKPDIETHLIITPAGERTISIETEYSTADVRSLADYNYRADDITAAPASGSFLSDGMIVAPCSMKTLSAIANSHTDDLLTRAADVTLKEHRRLLLMPRETPLHAGHLRNMLRVAEMGCVILPPVPAFYHKPHSVEDIVDYAVGKTLDIFRIEHTLFERWRGVNGINNGTNNYEDTCRNAEIKACGRDKSDIVRMEETCQSPKEFIGNGRTRIGISVNRIGKDLIVCLFNDAGHIGAAAVADYCEKGNRASVSVITRHGHMEDAIASDAARRLCKASRQPVCVIVGIHLDNITKEEIAEITANCEKLISRHL